MNKADILEYVDTRCSSTAKQVFSSVSTSKSSSTIGAAKDAAIAYAKRLNRGVTLNEKQYIDSEAVDTFIVLAEAEELSGIKKFLLAPLRGTLLRLTCFVFDLNFKAVQELRKQNDPDYQEVGIGILLAGLFLIAD